jgi:hypothetical protein
MLRMGLLYSIRNGSVTPFWDKINLNFGIFLILQEELLLISQHIEELKSISALTMGQGFLICGPGEEEINPETLIGLHDKLLGTHLIVAHWKHWPLTWYFFSMCH